MLKLEDEIKRLVLGGAKSIHFDIMDGIFVPRYGLPPEILVATRSITDLSIDAHMMTVEPEKYIKTFIDAGANFITVHAEACTHLHRTLKIIQENGAKVGIALNHSTPLSALDYILDDIDLILLMAINPGIVGHQLIPKAIEKISDLRTKLGEKYKDVIIEIDGGVTFESAPKLLKAGANMLVCGSSTIFKADINVDVNIIELIKHLSNYGF
jgi:ribulose-phosphate 3-epimerase